MDNHVFSLVLQEIPRVTSNGPPKPPVLLRHQDARILVERCSMLASITVASSQRTVCYVKCPFVIDYRWSVYAYSFIVLTWWYSSSQASGKMCGGILPRKNYHDISPKYKAIFHNLADEPMISQHVHQDFTKISWPSIYDIHWYCITSHQVSLVIKSYDGYTSDIYWWIFITRYHNIPWLLNILGGAVRGDDVQDVLLRCGRHWTSLNMSGRWWKGMNCQAWKGYHWQNIHT